MSPFVQCPNCRQSLQPGGNFCPYCGVQVAPAPFADATQAPFGSQFGMPQPAFAGGPQFEAAVPVGYPQTCDLQPQPQPQPSAASGLSVAVMGAAQQFLPGTTGGFFGKKPESQAAEAKKKHPGKGRGRRRPKVNRAALAQLGGPKETGGGSLKYVVSFLFMAVCGGFYLDAHRPELLYTASFGMLGVPDAKQIASGIKGALDAERGGRLKVDEINRLAELSKDNANAVNLELAEIGRASLEVPDGALDGGLGGAEIGAAALRVPAELPAPAMAPLPSISDLAPPAGAPLLESLVRLAPLPDDPAAAAEREAGLASAPPARTVASPEAGQPMLKVKVAASDDAPRHGTDSAKADVIGLTSQTPEQMEAVAYLQKLGFLSDENLRLDAVRAFQSRAGLKRTGEVDRDLLVALDDAVLDQIYVSFDTEYAFVGPAFRNTLRARLSASDLDSIHAATERALSDQGAIVEWSSDAGGRGQALAGAAVDDPDQRRRACFGMTLNIELEGRPRRTGNSVICQEKGQWQLAEAR